MTWSLQPDTELGIIEIGLADTVTFADLLAATGSAVLLARESDVGRFLFDGTRIYLTASLFEVLELPTEHFNRMGLDIRSRIALVTREASATRETFDFFSLACRNRGWNVAAFSDRSDAIRWLTGSPGAIRKG
jgi:hypothetical protein